MKYFYNKYSSIFISLFLSLNAFAQDDNSAKFTASNKGKVFFSWGGNKETYSKSDIHFKGDNYNFTIKDATSHDKPKGWHLDYINPTRMTIPQTNFKIGYFISDHYVITFGVDHMKYVMNQNYYIVDGYINLPGTEEGSTYNGVYNNESFLVSKDFLEFEHTDGLNYIYLEFARVDDVSSLLKIRNTDKIQFNVTEGIGAGGLYPKTNAKLLGKNRHDEFHVSGYGVSANVGLNITFFKYFFTQLNLKGGFINMPDIRTTSNAADSASQHFFYFQHVISFGGIFRI